LFYNTGTLFVGSYNTTRSIKIDANSGKIIMFGAINGSVEIFPSFTGTNWNLVLPPDGGDDGYLLSTDGAGETSWVSLSTTGTTSVSVTGGVNTPSSGVLDWSVYGTVASLNLGNLTGTSNGGEFEITGLPSQVQPLKKHTFVGRVQLGSSLYAFGLVQITTTGTIKVYADATGTNFTNAASVGLYDNNTFVYPLI
jgi:hypothetical protein